MKRPYVTVVITAAGLGKRFNGDTAGVPKQFYPLCGVPVLSRTAAAFSQMKCVDEIVVSLPSGFAFDLPFSKISAVTAGGADRQASVFEALCRVSTGTDIVLIHDGVRPFVTEELTIDVINCVNQGFATVAGIRATDTIKQTNQDGLVVNTPDRAHLWQVQTPQGFTYEVIMKAHEMARREGFVGTDDSMLVERYELAPVKIVESFIENIKITTRRDIALAEVYLESI